MRRLICAVMVFTLWARYRKQRYRIPLRLQLLDALARLSFYLSGMSSLSSGGRWRSVLGTSGRRAFEALKRISDAPVATGEWAGVRSEDIEIQAYEADHLMRCRVYTPAVCSDAMPVCVWIHGGGWTLSHVSDAEYDLVCRRLVIEGGWLVVAPEYRLAPEHPFPAGLCDTYACAAWVAEQSRSKVNPLLRFADGKGIIIAGDSAGGNLAAVIAVLANSGASPLPQTPNELRNPGTHMRRAINVRHQLLVYPGMLPKDINDFPSRNAPDCQWIIPTSVTKFMESCYFGADAAARDNLRSDLRVSPLEASMQDLAGLAPATIVLAENDPLHDEGTAYAQLLLKCGVKVTKLRYAATPHGFFCPNLPAMLHVKETRDAIRDAVADVQRSIAAVPGWCSSSL